MIAVTSASPKAAVVASMLVVLLVGGWGYKYDLDCVS